MLLYSIYKKNTFLKVFLQRAAVLIDNNSTVIIIIIIIIIIEVLSYNSSSMKSLLVPLAAS